MPVKLAQESVALQLQPEYWLAVLPAVLSEPAPSQLFATVSPNLFLRRNLPIRDGIPPDYF